jgi:hypothetical protein
VLLAFVTAATAARIAMREFGQGGGTVSRGYAVVRLDKITDVAIFGLSILFVVWFRRARINAEQPGVAAAAGPRLDVLGLDHPCRQLVVPVPAHGRHLAGGPAGVPPPQGGVAAGNVVGELPG